MGFALLQMQLKEECEGEKQRKWEGAEESISTHDIKLDFLDLFTLMIN